MTPEHNLKRWPRAGACEGSRRHPASRSRGNL